MKKRLIFGIVLLLAFSPAILPQPFCADCPETVTEILNQIDTRDNSGNRPELLRLLRCLWNPVRELAVDYDRFGSDDIFDEIEEATYEGRLEVIKALVPMLKSKDRVIRAEVAAALGYFKFPTAKQWLSEYPDSPDKAVLYAILKYARSYRWAIDQLDKLDKREAAEEADLLVERMSYMNLLYHLAEPGSLPFINSLIKSSPDAKIKDRAIMTRDNILRLHPDIR